MVAHTYSSGGADPFAARPFLVFWEITRACALACRHCRAEAQPHRHPGELDRAEASRLIYEYFLNRLKAHLAR